MSDPRSLRRRPPCLARPIKIALFLELPDEPFDLPHFALRPLSRGPPRGGRLRRSDGRSGADRRRDPRGVAGRADRRSLSARGQLLDARRVVRWLPAPEPEVERQVRRGGRSGGPRDVHHVAVPPSREWHVERYEGRGWLPPSRPRGGPGVALLRRREERLDAEAHRCRQDADAEQARRARVSRQLGLQRERRVRPEDVPHVVRRRRSVLLRDVDLQAQGTAAAAVVVLGRLARRDGHVPHARRRRVSGLVLRGPPQGTGVREEHVRGRAGVLQPARGDLHAAGRCLRNVIPTNSNSLAACMSYLWC